jgi:hypothetical protein
MPCTFDLRQMYFPFPDSVLCGAVFVWLAEGGGLKRGLVYFLAAVWFFGILVGVDEHYPCFLCLSDYPLLDDCCDWWVGCVVLGA